MNRADVTRQIYWNIAHVWLMYASLAPTMALAFCGVYRRVSCWHRGFPLARFDNPAARLKLVLKHALVHTRVAQQRYSGLFHWLTFSGFIVLAVATTVVALDADFGTTIMRGGFYLYFQSFTVDVFGALVMLGILMAAARRYLR